jgi:hypothetical protein
MTPKLRKFLLWIAGGVLVALLIVVWWFIASVKPRGPLARVQLADGRILQIEGVTFGMEHRIGQAAPVLDRFGNWLPFKLRERLAPRHPENRIHTDKPGLVVWVNAIDPGTGKAVDCQGIRVEFVDGHGDLMAAYQPNWFGGQNFWRVGHIFHAYPRDQRQLTLQITPWRTNVASRVEFPNPHVVQPARWTGGALPQQTNFGRLEVALTSLERHTNGSAKKYWETPTAFWRPKWELRREGKPAAGWSKPEWTAEDPLGNRGEYLGVHQPVLRYEATIYPAATNLEDAVLLGTMPAIAPNGVATNIVWWNTNIACPAAAGGSKSNELLALGFFPAGMYVFSEGKFVTNNAAAMGMGPTRGGSPSGWVGSERRDSPFHVTEWAGHYGTNPVIYLHLPPLGPAARVAIRLRDEQGKCWTAKPEPEGDSDGIMPYLLQVPAEVKTLVPEIVLLNSLHVEFLVDTGAESKK